MIKFYTFQVDWIYSAWTDGEEILKTSYGVVAAHNYAEAVEKITERMPMAHNITIDECADPDFIFMSQYNYLKIKNEFWGLDVPEEDCCEF